MGEAHFYPTRYFLTVRLSLSSIIGSCGEDKTQERHLVKRVSLDGMGSPSVCPKLCMYVRGAR